MSRALRVSLLLLLLLTVAGAFIAEASPHGGILPSVPVSSFARPAAWLDPSRLHMSTELSFGTGFGGGPSHGLQVTRFSYQVGQPLALQVSLGNAFGGARGSEGSFFLEGLDLAYQPFRSLSIQVHYQDLRSPLQLTRGGFYPYTRQP